MAQQTAVQWLQEQLNPDMKTMQGNIMQDLLEQAKQMEKEQMENMFFVGGQNGYLSCEGKPFETFEKYYNETYGK